MQSIWHFVLWWGFETAVLDIVMGYHAYHSLKFLGVLRLFLKLLTSAAWLIVLTVCYVHTWSHPQGLIKDIQNWLGKGWENSYLYVAAVVLYLVPNVIGGFFFLFPMLRRWIESSNWRIVRFLLWWSQVCSSVPFSLFGLCRTCASDTCKWSLSHFLFWTEWGIPNYNFAGFLELQFQLLVPTMTIGYRYVQFTAPSLHWPRNAWKSVCTFWVSTLWP